MMHFNIPYRGKWSLMAVMAVCTTVKAQDYDPKRVYTKLETETFKSRVNKHPDSVSYHMQYIYSVWPDKNALQVQYGKWMKQHPGKFAIPFALGKMFYMGEYPEAKTYLSKAVQLNPHLAEAYYMLSMDAERWGNRVAGMKFMERAALEAPDNGGYAFYYAMDAGKLYPDSMRAKVYELTRKFPKDERGAQGLYIIGTSGNNLEEKTGILEDLRRLYSPREFRWSQSGVIRLYDYYLPHQPEKALGLVQDMPADLAAPRDTLARDVMRIKGLLKEERYAEAATIADGLKVPYRSSLHELILLLKAEVSYAGGNAAGAYNSLLSVYAGTPTDIVEKNMYTYGSSIGKTNEAVMADVWRKRDSVTRPAAPFALGMYTADKKLSLEECKGKVVLLTFWFPGCGPCRAEFPHFQNVISKYSTSQVSYLGVNVFPEQDAYVLPFMESYKYSFIPLKGTAAWAKEAYGVRAEPTNFLIDQEGRIVFSHFRTDETNEQTLQMMINSLLERSGNR